MSADLLHVLKKQTCYLYKSSSTYPLTEKFSWKTPIVVHITGESIKAGDLSTPQWWNLLNINLIYSLGSIGINQTHLTNKVYLKTTKKNLKNNCCQVIIKVISPSSVIWKPQRNRNIVLKLKLLQDYLLIDMFFQKTTLLEKPLNYSYPWYM
jgi:hypothetical protein